MRRFDLRVSLHWEKEFNTEDTESAEDTVRKEKSTLLFAEPAVQDGLIGVDAAVAEEGPIAARVFALGGIALDDENFFLVVRSFGNHLAKGIGNERIPPEFQTRVAILRLAFETNAIDDRGVNTVCNGVAALNGFPGVELRAAELRFFMRVPANTGGIKNHVRTAKSGEARAFGIPLVPADLYADTRVSCIKIRETKIARREIKLL